MLIAIPSLGKNIFTVSTTITIMLFIASNISPEGGISEKNDCIVSIPKKTVLITKYTASDTNAINAENNTAKSPAKKPELSAAAADEAF